jgi:hypothetical protein
MTGNSEIIQGIEGSSPMSKDHGCLLKRATTPNLRGASEHTEPVSAAPQFDLQVRREVQQLFARKLLAHHNLDRVGYAPTR